MLCSYGAFFNLLRIKTDGLHYCRQMILIMTVNAKRVEPSNPKWIFLTDRSFCCLEMTH